MKNRRLAFICFFIHLLTFYSLPSMAALADNTSIAPMLQKVMPAIVNIRAIIKVTDFTTLQEIAKQRQNNQNQGDHPDNNSDNNADQPLPNTFVSVGSGVIVDAKNGYILTNAHVVNDAQSVTIALSNGRHYRDAKIVGIDKPSDVALLQIKAKDLVAIPLGNSNNVKVGDFVAAIGNPFGLSQTVTSGIVSAIGRTKLGIESYENFIQTDASINPGNSGGALINMQGQLIGINTAILAPNRGNVGIGFAIPANMAKSVMEQLIEYGNVKRGVLGIGAQDISPELASAFHLNTTQGAAVAQVLPHSPAAQAGFKVGDVITAVNGNEVKTADDVVNAIGFLRVDSKASVSVLRNNNPLTITVSLSDPKTRAKAIEELDPFLYGVGLKDFTLSSPIHGNIEGVLVVSVEEDSNSWHDDLRPGDVIISANQQTVKNIQQLKSITEKADKMLLLNVLRGPGALFLVINKS